MKFRSLRILVLVAMVSIQFSYAQNSKVHRQNPRFYIKTIELKKEFADVPAALMSEHISKMSMLYSKEQMDYLAADDLDDLERFITKNPHSVYNKIARLDLANLYFEQGNFKKAIQWFESAANRYYTGFNDQSLLRMGFSYIQVGDYSNAEKLLNEIQLRPGKQEVINYYQGYISYQKGDLDRAEKQLEGLSDNSSYDLSYILLDIEFQSKAFAKAVQTGEVLFPRSTGVQKSMVAKILGDAYFELGNYDKSIEYLEFYSQSGIKIESKHFYMLGYAYYKNSDFENALVNFNKIAAQESALAQNAFYHLGQVYLKLNDQNAALNAFKSSSEMNYSTQIQEDAFYNYAKLSYAIGNPYEAPAKVLESYTEKYTLSSHRSEIYQLIISSYFKQEDFVGGIQYLERVGITQNEAAYQQFQLEEGLVQLKSFQFDQALKHFRQAASRDKDKISQSRAYFWMGETQFAQSNYTQATLSYKRALQIGSKINFEEKKEINYSLGYSVFKSDKYADARGHFEAYLNSNPQSSLKSTDAIIRLGDTYFMEQSYWKAMQQYNKALQVGGDHLDYTTYQKALCYGLVKNNQAKIDLLSNFDQRFPRSSYRPDAYFELGSTLSNQGKNEAAVKAFQKLVEYYPRNEISSKALLKEGLIYYNTGKNSQAIQVFQYLATSFSNLPIAQQAVNNVQRIYREQGNLKAYADWVNTLDFVSYSDDELANDTYETALTKYRSQDYKLAESLFKTYLKEYKEGPYTIASQYYLGMSQEALGNSKAAIVNFEAVRTASNSEYYDQAGRKLIIFYLEEQDWEKSLNLLKKLENESLSEQNLDFIQSNIMNAYQKLGAYQEAQVYAEKLLQREGIEAKVKLDARYTIAKSQLEISNYDKASESFKLIIDDLDGIKKVEALYSFAMTEYRKENFETSNDEIKSMLELAGGNNLYRAKGLLLMAKNFKGLEDEFQSSYILENLIKKYPEFEDIKKEAELLLTQIKNQENEVVQ